MKVSKATGSALNWMVAKALGQKVTYSPYVQFQGQPNEKIVGWGVYLDPCERDEFGVVAFDPSDNWSQGGPIIDRERIGLTFDCNGPDILWEGKKYAFDGTLLWNEYGPTALIAAMRCFVASKLGDEVDVPEELLS